MGIAFAAWNASDLEGKSQENLLRYVRFGGSTGCQRGHGWHWTGRSSLYGNENEIHRVKTGFLAHEGTTATVVIKSLPVTASYIQHYLFLYEEYDILSWKLCLTPASFLLDVLFEIENEGDMFVRSVGGFLPNYIALQPNRSYASCSPLWEPQIQHIYLWIMKWRCQYVRLHNARW
jgi:hypothetical protein